MTEPNEPLVQVGWYCWRCEGLVERPCRSDNVPVSVPQEWAADMEAEIRRLGEEGDDVDLAANSAEQPARTTPDNPATSSNTADNPT